MVKCRFKGKCGDEGYRCRDCMHNKEESHYVPRPTRYIREPNIPYWCEPSTTPRPPKYGREWTC